MAEREQPAQLKTLTEGRADVAARRSFTAAAGVRGHGKMTLIPPTQPTADGIEVGTERKTLSPCQSRPHPERSGYI